MGIEDEYVAYCLDEACFMWGNHVQGELDKVEGKNSKEIEGRRKLLMRSLLSDEPKSRYATPIATM